MIKLYNLANEARESISSYCINVCKAQCCQRGKLLLMSNDEEKAIMGYKKEEFIEKGITKISEKGFIHYDLEMKKCKNLNNKDFTCKIHSNSNRPLVCRDYPIFLVKDYVMFATGCPAVQNGKLKSYEEKFKKLGVKIV